MKLDLKIGDKIIIKKAWNTTNPSWNTDMDYLIGKIRTIDSMSNHRNNSSGNINSYFRIKHEENIPTSTTWSIYDDSEYIKMVDKVLFKIKFNPKKYITNENT